MIHSYTLYSPPLEALLMVVFGAQLFTRLVFFVSSRLQAFNFELVLNQIYQPLDAYNTLF